MYICLALGSYFEAIIFPSRTELCDIGGWGIHRRKLILRIDGGFLSDAGRCMNLDQSGSASVNPDGRGGVSNNPTWGHKKVTVQCNKCGSKEL